MKKMRRFLSLFMCMVLSAVCLAGCGGKSDEALLTASVKNLNEAKNCDITAKMSGKMKVSIGDFSQDVDMDMDITSTMFMDPVKTKVVSTLNSAGTSVKSESYIAKFHFTPFIVHFRISHILVIFLRNIRFRFDRRSRTV